MFKKDFGFFVDEKYSNNFSVSLSSFNNGINVYKINLHFDIPTSVKDLKICYFKPMRGMLSIWHSSAPRNRALRQWFDKNSVRSNFYLGAPLVSVVDGEKNYCTIALSDAQTPCELNAFVDDFADNEEICYDLILFKGIDKLISDYSIFVRIDEQDKPYFKAISSVKNWWDTFYPPIIDNCDSAEDALYSSWYNFHQHPNEETLKKELLLASKIGFKTVILDDGWQYDGNGTADYFDCGDWEFSKEKFPNPKEFIDYVHALGMKILVWFPVPFVGYNTQKYAEFKDKLLCDNDFFRAGILDPRYKEVREFLINTYREFVVKYDLDGLKLDFIDSFKLLPTSPAYDCAKMDFEDVEKAVDCLLEGVIQMLKDFKEHPLFEFRQNYVGPAITRYCNMLRVSDCAFDSVTNKIAVVDLRLLNYDLAVHSDMLYWAKDEKPVNVKKQLLNVLFSVPQISVLLTNSTSEHLDIIKNHIDYFNKNKKILLHGEIQPVGNDLLYPCVSSSLGDKTVSVISCPYSIEYNGKKHDIFNNSDVELVSVVSTVNCFCKVVDIYGKVIKNFEVVKGANLIKVPVGGMIAF